VYKRGVTDRFSLLLLLLCGGCRAVEAPAFSPYRAGSFAALVRGTYVAVGEACSNPSAVFRYDGWGVGWIGRGSDPAALYPIVRVREGPEEYVATVSAPGPGVDGADHPREVEVSIVAMGDGERIVVTAMERTEMRLCAEDALPVWARERPVFMQYLPGKAPLVLKASAGGILTQRGPCLGVILDDGRFSTAVWPATARIEFDSHGLVVVDGREGGARVRLGDYVQFTGGPLPKGTRYPLGGDVHVVDMPMACAHYPGYDGWIAIVNPGFRKGRRP
jgi:hypothetical protein